MNRKCYLMLACFHSLLAFAQLDTSLVLTFNFNDHKIKEDHELISIKPVGVTLTEDRFGNSKSAIYLHGNRASYLNLGNSDLIKLRKGSISLWVNIQAKVLSGRGYKGNPLFITRCQEGEDFNIAFGLGYSIPSSRFGTQSTLDSMREATVFAEDTVRHGRWYHLVATIDDHYLALYVDGKLQGKNAKEFVTTYLKGDSVLIGRSLGFKNERYAHAIVDDIRFFHYVLNQSEIEKLYEEPNPNRIKDALIEALKYIVVIVILIIVIILLLIRNRKNLRKQKEFYELNSRVQELEIKVIRSQMNPHFISNSLAAIQHLIHKKEIESAGLYLAKFSFFLRQVLDHSDKSYIRLSEELEIVRLYVELEQLRFDDNFSFGIRVAENIDTFQVQIPSLITQPFIENSIWHGLLPLKERDPSLELSVLRLDDKICLLIEDNGVGRTAAEDLAKKSRGTRLALDKIESLNKLSNGSNVNIRIVDLFDNQGKPAGTRIEIYLHNNEE